jgi:aspartate aminotransferase
MALLSSSIADSLLKGSWIRRMFEAGIALKKEHGEDAVCDFSLGNPDLPPPPIVAEAMHKLADSLDRPFSLGYMPNGGYLRARAALAEYLSREQGLPLAADEVILTCGAAGGLNTLFKAILNPGDEVLSLSPYFVEYGAYVSNHQGVFRAVPTLPETFSIDINALDAAITAKTRALLLNSPNNPTGQIYSRDELSAVVALLEEKSRLAGHPIFLVSDEPYRFLAYDGEQVTPLLPLYDFAVVAGSFSKNMSMPGERIGYLALSPKMPGRDELMNGLILCNRILGYVNPPVVGQHLMCAALGFQVDAQIYKRRRDAMARVLSDAGYQFLMPKGAFYFFPKAPGGDDVAFVNTLMRHLILAVPGSGFGGPGYFRMACCVDEQIINRAADGLKKALHA